jgi:hypothetical protein
MTSNAPKNIFEAVSKSEHERRQQAGKEPLPAAEPQIPSVDKMLDRCRTLHENIASSLDRIFNSRGISQNQYQKYVTTQRNFSSKDWEMIKETKKNTEKELAKLQIITKTREEEEKAALTKKEHPKSEVQTTTPSKFEPKRKPITRRQWLQMH